ncbi:YggT family protein [Alteromonas oceanisediminis]|uniref:YggT family protein n=1 Tax=Alteromonas oceanisediminis TaxID=2836180 RepID=UPI001BD96C06|nr:YggT family protein [Alteromonas oceanisediminis]MBT0585490.1 YggT family protein [Alteromonas oceanisediminis]
MNATYFLVSTLFNLYLMVVLLRLWLQLARADFYNPLSQVVVKATQPVVGPLRRVIPSIGPFDTATFVFALAVSALKIVVISLMFSAPLNPIGVIVAALIDMLREGLSLVFWVLILRAILSWVSQGNNPVEYVLMQLTEPFLRPIRSVLPQMGGLDLSVLVAIIALQFIRILLGDVFGGF